MSRKFTIILDNCEVKGWENSEKQADWDCMWLTAVVTQNNVVKYHTQILLTK